MTTDDQRHGFLTKAAENLTSAAAEFTNRRYNACANRCYFSCFQAAVAALMQAGVHPRGARPEWGHDFVQAQFAGQLLSRRKVYPTEIRDTLPRLLALRKKADYDYKLVSQAQAAHAVQRASEFVASI